MATLQWVLDLAEKHDGRQLCFVMEKTVEKSDLDRQQNRLRIPKQCVANSILPILDRSERDAANLADGIDGPPKKKTKVPGEDDKKVKKKKEVGRVPDVLPVEIYDRAGFGFCSGLVRWDSSSTVLRSGEWLLFAAWSGFKVGDKVEMWAFRRREGHRVCFVVAKKD